MYLYPPPPPPPGIITLLSVFLLGGGGGGGGYKKSTFPVYLVALVFSNTLYRKSPLKEDNISKKDKMAGPEDDLSFHCMQKVMHLELDILDE